MPFACCGGKSDVVKDIDGMLSGASVMLDPTMRDKPIIKAFEERISKGKINEKKTAIHFGDNLLLTYAQLNAFASCLAKGLIERLGYDYKLTPDNDLVIAICLPMSEKTMSLVFGVLKIGAAYLPLDPQYPEDVIKKIIRDFQPALLITDDNGNIFNKFDFEEFAQLCKIVSIEELWLDIEFTKEPKTRRASMELAWEIDFLEKKAQSGEHPVVIISCLNKESVRSVGVRIGNKSILNLISYHWSKFKMSEKDSCCITVPIASPMSIPQIFIPLLLGCTLNLFRRRDVSDMGSFLKNVAWQKVTRLSIPTHHLKPMLDSITNQETATKLHSLKSLKFVVCRGSIIPRELVGRFFSIFRTGVCLSNCTGLVQTTGEIAFEIYDCLKDYESKLEEGRSTFGLIVNNLKIYILDKNMNLVKNGNKGEICVSGDCLALGYVGKEPIEKGSGAGKDKFLPNPFREESETYSRMYKSEEFGYIVQGKRRIFPDEKHDIIATEQDGDLEPHEERKW